MVLRLVDFDAPQPALIKINVRANIAAEVDPRQ
jgi:hypothetical protein